MISTLQHFRVGMNFDFANPEMPGLLEREVTMISSAIQVFQSRNKNQQIALTVKTVIPQLPLLLRQGVVQDSGERNF